MQTNVMLLVGGIASGKTTLLQAIAQHARQRVTVVSRAMREERLPAVNWEACDCLAVDGVGGWYQDNRAAILSQWEADAIRLGKLLILVVSDRTELARVGVVLVSEPAVLELSGESASPLFWLLGSLDMRKAA